MVRRWAYLNNINKPFTFSYFKGSNEGRRVRFVYQELAFFDTTLFRKKLTRQAATKFRRLGWLHRKHRAEWVLYRNLLINWSQDYRFFRRYNRFLLLLHMFKNSYFLFNLPLMANVAVSEVNEFRSVHVASVVARTMRYFCPLNPLFYKFFTVFRSMTWLYASTPEIRSEGDLATETTDSLLYHMYQSRFYTTDEVQTSLSWLSVLLQLFFVNTLATLVDLYKWYVILIFYRVQI